MGSQTDLSSLKDIPGYRAILKSVLKSQIQLLLEQLADNTGEESIILTASVNDGSLSHLGSTMGKGFLDGREEIKSQFLGFCLKGHHQMKQGEDRSSTFGRSDMVPIPQYGSRRPRIRPHPYSMSPSNAQQSSTNRVNSQDFSTTSSPFLKTEEGSSNSADNFLDSVSSNITEDQMGFPSSVNLSHTQTSSQSANNDLNQSGVSDEKDNQSVSETQIKLEPVSGDLEDEVQIVESEENSSENWGHGDANEASHAGFNGTSLSSIDMSLSEHYTSHTIWRNNFNTKIYTCNFCGKQTPRKGDIDRHVIKHTKEKPFTCNLCRKGFTRKRALVGHLLRMHPDDVQSERMKAEFPDLDMGLGQHLL